MSKCDSVESSVLATRKGSDGLSIPLIQREVTLAGTDYVLVRKELARDEAKDQKELATPQMARMSVPLRGKRKGNSFLTRQVAELTTQTSAANTAVAFSLALKPSASANWSSTAGMFDAARVRAVRLHARMNASAVPSASHAAWGFAYDPGVGVAPTSISDVISNSYRVGPISADGSDNASIIPMSRTGYLTLDAPTEKILEPSALGDLVGGNWFPVTSGTNATVGFAAGYCEALGSAVTSSTTIFVEYEIEFRYRN